MKDWISSSKSGLEATRVKVMPSLGTEGHDKPEKEAPSLFKQL